MITCLNLLILILVCWEGKTGLSGNDYIEFMKKKYISEIPKYVDIHELIHFT